MKKRQYKEGYKPASHGKGKSYRWLADHMGYTYDACLMWPFTKTRGYGTLAHQGERHYAHRVMCELVNGPAPSDKHQAAHSCGNGDRGCVHPQHLNWKTNGENQLDRREHGTTDRNHKSYTGRATPEQVAQIRALNGIKTHDEIAKLFGFTRQNISAIIAGKTFSRPRKLPPLLTPEQIRTIREIGTTKSAKEVAEMFGVARNRIYKVRLGIVYGHIN